MFSNMGLHSQPCGIKRTIDQVAEDSPADYINPCQPWQKQPVPYSYHAKRDNVHTRHEEPVYPNRSPDAVDSTARPDILHHQAVDSVCASEVYTGEYFAPMRTNFNGTAFKYGYDEMYSGVGKDEVHNNQHNETVITYEQQSEARQFRRTNFNSNRLGDCKKGYEDPMLNGTYNTHDQTKTEEKYWSFGWNTNCPKKPNNQVFYHKPNTNTYCNDQNFNSRDAFQDQPHVQVTEQQIQCDENGKSYLELSGKTTFTYQEEWRTTWTPAERQYTPASGQQVYETTPAINETMNEENRSWQPQSQSHYRHQRLSILSLSMLKLNRFRQCSDPSLHKSVLICNTLRHIEDEMEREESLTRRPKLKARAHHSSYDSYHQTQQESSYDSSCGAPKVLNDRHSNVAKKNCEIVPNNQQYTQDYCNSNRSTPNVYTYRRSSEFDKSFATLETVRESANDKGPEDNHMGYDIHSNGSTVSGEDVVKLSPMSTVNEPQKCAEEINREIDWGSVLMSSAGFECFNSNSIGAQQTHQSCVRSDYAAQESSWFVTNGNGEMYDENAWKNNQFASNVAVNQRHNLSEFTVLRRRNELADELDGFVQILVGS